MSRMRIRTGVALLALVALLAFANLATAGSPGYTLSWWSVDGGGGSSSGGGYALNGSAGQPEAAVWQVGAYTLTGGFWGGLEAEYRLYLPLVIRNV